MIAKPLCEVCPRRLLTENVQDRVLTCLLDRERLLGPVLLDDSHNPPCQGLVAAAERPFWNVIGYLLTNRVAGYRLVSLSGDKNKRLFEPAVTRFP